MTDPVRIGVLHLFAHAVRSRVDGLTGKRIGEEHEAVVACLEARMVSQQVAGQGPELLVQQKAVIFTESRRTQEYLFRVLEQTEFAGKAMLFNGTNTDATSKVIYRQWVEKHAGTDHISGSPTADMHAALVEYFRDEAAILIATEAAAEGINLQFCNLVVNYDLPWNPQRIGDQIVQPLLLRRRHELLHESVAVGVLHVLQHLPAQGALTDGLEPLLQFREVGVVAQARKAGPVALEIAERKVIDDADQPIEFE
jgi:hypothetical protein